MFETYSEILDKNFKKECEDGWNDTIFSMFSEILLLKHSLKRFNGTISKIVVYYGGMKIVHTFDDYRAYDIIKKYELQSYSICEITGSKGILCELDGYKRVFNEDLMNTLGFKPLDTIGNIVIPPCDNCY